MRYSWSCTATSVATKVGGYRALALQWTAVARCPLWP